jgi:hypothetical protein
LTKYFKLLYDVALPLFCANFVSPIRSVGVIDFLQRVRDFDTLLILQYADLNAAV